MGGVEINELLAIMGLPPSHNTKNPATILEFAVCFHWDLYDFFITHGRGFCDTASSRNLLDQNLFLKVLSVFYAIILFIHEVGQAKTNIKE